MTSILTYSLDGGAPVTIPDASQPFTPTVPGTYVFTYAFVHSDPRVTDCYTAITRTLIVDPCGTAAELSTNKTTLKVGESATLTYPAPEAGETAKLSYTKDGGSAQTMTGKTFTPSAPGTYVLTYSITTSCGTTTASVTINVYDCGPEATVTASRTTVRPDDPITITVSSPGADETATLTVSYNGGAAQPAAPGTWSAHDEGTYTFTYTITHPYIDCTRSASVMVSVSDCGTAVLLTADKSVLTLGEAVNLSASRAPDANETATLTYSLNGGTPQPLTPNPLTPNPFTPTAVGTYTVTYTLHNNLLDCETSSEVSFSVYECGPAISLETDKSILRLGESVNLTLSQPGADETATLTYSLNGGAPVSLTPNPLTPNPFAPTELGTYVFTYTITHPYISCTRTATATVKVYDCGTPASITADQTALESGTSTNLHLSAVLPDETATLTYTINGGVPISLTPNPQTPNPFTSTEAGTYVFTYTVSHTLIECETSAQVTIKAYDCGPAATITLSQEEAKLLRPITITVSSPGADETATLTYSLNGGAPVSLTPNPQTPNPFAPTELGTYVFTYTITHPYINCERTATATLRVVEAELVFDDNNGTHVWSDPKNWWPAYNRLPNDADSAIIRRNCNVDIDRAVSYDLTFDGGTIAIQPKGALVVIHRMLQVASNSITVLTDATGNGALVLGPENTNIPAAVQFYSSAADIDQLYPRWQYMGSPLRDPQSIAASYPQAVVYEWTNTPNKQVGGNWQRVDSLAGTVQPFTGYCLTQKSARTYPLSGTLNDPATKTVTIPYNDQGRYPGFAFVANSWVAPIDIASLETSDFGAADATVYIMNAGTYAEALQQQSQAAAGTGAAAGQYNTIPVHAASYLPNALTVIPSMQGFFVHTNAATTLTLDYDKAVYTPAKTKVSTMPTRAPQRINHKSETINVESLIRLHVSGYGSEDEVYLLEGDGFTYAFENGWDGRKVLSERSNISLAVSSPEGALAVAALPQIIGTEILFDGGNHKKYTITFETLNHKFETLNPLYLLDKETNDYTELTEGATYTFKCGAATRRFVITTLDDPINGQMENDQKLKPIKFLYNGILYIRLGDRLYNGVGELISTAPENPISIK